MRSEFQKRDHGLAFSRFDNVGPVTEKDTVSSGSAVLHISLPNGLGVGAGKSEIAMRL